MTDTALNLDVTPDQLIARYIELRDLKKVNEDKYAAFMKEKFGAPMEAIELQLLDMLNKLGAQNLNADTGKVFKVTKTSVTTADQREFQRHIIGGELWDLIEWRPAKTAINDLVEGGDPLPPGLNRSTFVTVNIRRN